MDESDLREDDAPYPTFRRRRLNRALIVPVVMLLLVVAVVSGLVFGGIVQGDKSRLAPEQAPTTQSTVLIVPHARRGCAA